jgi:hypothetical protein
MRHFGALMIEAGPMGPELKGKPESIVRLRISLFAGCTAATLLPRGIIGLPGSVADAETDPHGRPVGG